MSAGLKVWLVFAFLALGLSVLMLLDGAAQVQARPATLNLAE